MRRLILSLFCFFMLSGFSEIPQWQRVNVSPAYEALQRACSSQKAKAPDAALCRELLEKRLKSAEEKRQFFEAHYSLQSLTDQALLTGYYLPLLEGSYEPSAEYPYPVWGVPADFKKPYLTRRQIDKGALNGKERPILWVKDRIDLFFLHVQGSGRVRLPDGEVIGLGFAAKNGQPYQSIGKLLIEEQEITREAMSLQALKKWLRAHPEQVSRVLWHNPSFVFFQLQKDKMAVGAQGVPLTPQGSLAVDPSHIPYGTPVLIETTLPETLKPVQLLTIAQDTGSAIKGEARADWFLGHGSEAEAQAGQMKQPARFTLLKRKRDKNG